MKRSRNITSCDDMPKETAHDNVVALTCRNIVLQNAELGRIIANFLTFPEQFVMVVIVRGQKVHGDIFEFLTGPCDESRVLRGPWINLAVNEFLGLLLVRSEIPNCSHGVYRLDSDKLTTVSRNLMSALDRVSTSEETKANLGKMANEDDIHQNLVEPSTFSDPGLNIVIPSHELNIEIHSWGMEFDKNEVYRDGAYNFKVCPIGEGYEFETKTDTQYHKLLRMYNELYDGHPYSMRPFVFFFGDMTIIPSFWSGYETVRPVWTPVWPGIPFVE